MIDKYPTVDYDVKCLMMDPDTLQWIVFLPDMCHLTKILPHLSSRGSGIKIVIFQVVHMAKVSTQIHSSIPHYDVYSKKK